MTAAIADHKLDPYDPGGTGRHRRVQVDDHGAGAVGIDLIGARFPPWRREVGSCIVVALVITLREVAMAVEHLDAIDNPRRTIRKGEAGNAERVFALECRVRAPEIVGTSCPSCAAQRRQRDPRRQHSFPKPAFHARPPFSGIEADRTWLNKTAL